MTNPKVVYMAMVNKSVDGMGPSSCIGIFPDREMFVKWLDVKQPSYHIELIPTIMVDETTIEMQGSEIDNAVSLARDAVEQSKDNLAALKLMEKLV